MEFIHGEHRSRYVFVLALITIGLTGTHRLTKYGLMVLTMADPGFSFGRGGAPTPKVGVLTYFFPRKLHENERI